MALGQMYLAPMLQRTLPAGFIAPCLPIKTTKLPLDKKLDSWSRSKWRT